MAILCSWSGVRFARAVVNAHAGLAVARLVHFLGCVAGYTWAETPHNLSQFAVDLSTQTLTQRPLVTSPTSPLGAEEACRPWQEGAAVADAQSGNLPICFFCLYSYAPAYFLLSLIPRINKKIPSVFFLFLFILCILSRPQIHVFITIYLRTIIVSFFVV